MNLRNKGKRCNNFELKIENQTVDYAWVYRYLGVHLNEYMESTIIAKSLSKAGGRALGAVISKIQSYKDVGFKTYKKVYYSCVIPVLDYCCGAWDFKSVDKRYDSNSGDKAHYGSA